MSPSTRVPWGVGQVEAALSSVDIGEAIAIGPALHLLFESSERGISINKE